jgi:hypothetical protein
MSEFIQLISSGNGAITCWQIAQIGFISLLYLCAGQKFFTLDS